MPRLVITLTDQEWAQLNALTMYRQHARAVGAPMPHVEQVAADLMRMGLRQAQVEHYQEQHAIAEQALDIEALSVLAAARTAP